MVKVLAALAALLFACTALAQGGGLKPKPSTEAGRTEQAPAGTTVQVPPANPAEPNAGVETVEQIFACLAVGLPKDWRSVSIEVIELTSKGSERQFEAKYLYTRTLDSTPQPLQPCDATGAAKSVYALNDFLEPEKRLWKRAKLTFSSDGKFELKYEYAE